MNIKTIHYLSLDDCINNKIPNNEHVVIPKIGEHVEFYIVGLHNKYKTYVVEDVVFQNFTETIQVILKDWTK